jgi:dipeptidyl-peptidase-3
MTSSFLHVLEHTPLILPFHLQFLSCNLDVLKIFGHTEPTKQDDIVYVNWLSLCHAAVRGIEMYSPASSEWKQAHSQARFVMLQVLIEAGKGFVSVKAITGDDGKPDLLLTMDRTKVESVGKPAIGDFVQKLQVYKSTGDIVNARKMYDTYSAVNDERSDHPWASWRDIVLDRKQPRKMCVQANTKVEDEQLKLVEYSPSHEGMMESWRDRFTTEEHAEIDNILNVLFVRDQPHFGFVI